jgi:hypothetical protein
MMQVNMKYIQLIVVCLLVVGCKPKPGGDPATDALRSGKAEFADPLPRTKGDHPTRIVIRSDEEAGIDVGAGRGSNIVVAPMQATLGRLSLLVEDAWGACRCNPDLTCPEFEPPPRRIERVTKDSAMEIEWIGKLVRHGVEADGDWCGTSFVPPEGDYMLRVCDVTGKRCAIETVRLPPEKDIVLDLEPYEVSADACPLEPLGAARIATYHLVYMQLGGIVPERIAACEPSKALCVMPADLAAAKQRLRGEKCSLIVTPAGEEVESLVLLPLPAGTHGGESFQQFLSPDGFEIVRIRFEQ